MSYEPDVAAARFLLAPEGHAWLSRAANLPGTSASHLADVTYLRRFLAPDEAAAVLAQVQLRAQASGRFERAPEMLFTAVGLQQSTHPCVAAHRARRFAGYTVVADLGCGLGGDTLGLAQAAGHVLAADRDYVRLLFARHNAGVYGLADRVSFLQADALAPPFDVRPLAVFADPGRRSATGERAFRPEDYEPPLDSLWGVLRRARGFALKVGPGIAYEQLPWVDEVEIISLEGQVREAALWGGELATPGVRRRATLLPSGTTLIDTQPADVCPVRAPGRYIYEPDGAVIRAGLVRHAGTVLGLWQLDEHIAYLSGDLLVESPLVQTFEVEESLPFGLKPVRRWLQELKIGVLEIKKRGVDLDPDDFRRRLKLRGDHSKTLIITRIGDKPVAFLCERKTAHVSPEAPCA